MIDLDRGWSTERLDLEPLAVAHAAELAAPLDDTSLHEFTGGAPLPAAALAARYARLMARRSPPGDRNWIVRVRATGMAAGTVQDPPAGAGYLTSLSWERRVGCSPRVQESLKKAWPMAKIPR